jgi:molybdopterin synthase catalytic subunit
MIRVQHQAFDLGAEYVAFKAGRADVGGFAFFVGSVRDLSDGKDVKAVTLEHYPGMTEAALVEIEGEAHKRWPLQDVLIIHRFGKLMPGEDIVLVITASAHREAAFQACQFLMDWLKTKAPFWKLEEGTSGKHWVEAKQTDDAAATRWNKPGSSSTK